MKLKREKIKGLSPEVSKWKCNLFLRLYESQLGAGEGQDAVHLRRSSRRLGEREVGWYATVKLKTSSIIDHGAPVC